MQRNKVLHDRRVRAANFEMTDQVWLLDTAVTKGKTAKLSRRWKGPYKIMKKVNESTYNIRPVSGRGLLITAVLFTINCSSDPHQEYMWITTAVNSK